MHNDSRIPWLDYAKLFFVLGFAYTSIQRGLFRNGFTDFGHGFHVVDSLLQSTILPLCFFIAGNLFQIFQKQPSTARLYKLLTDKLLYAFVIWTVIQGVIEVVFSGYTGGASLAMDIYYDLISEPGTHFWVLIALIVHFCLATLLQRFRSNTSLTLIAGVSLFAYLYQDRLPNVYPLKYLPQYFIFFCIGQYYYRHISVNTKIVGNPLHVFWVSAALFGILQTPIQLAWVNTTHHSPLSFISSLLGVLALASLCRWLSKKFAALPHWVTRAVFPMFLLHAILGNGTREILANSFALTHSKLHLILACTVVLAVPLLVGSKIGVRVSRYLFASPAYLSPYKVLVHTGSVLKNSPFLLSSTLMTSVLFLGSLTALDLWAKHLIRKSSVSASVLAPGARELRLSDDPEVIAEGGRLAQVYGCYMGCHGVKMEGNILYRKPFFGVIAPPNLTKIFDKYSVADLDGIIRHGVWPDQLPVIRGMPSSAFNALNDDDFVKILSFIKNYPAQASTTPNNSLGIVNKFNVVRGKFITPAEEIAEAQALYRDGTDNSDVPKGQQIARAACGECHNYDLMGRSAMGSPPLLVVHAYNLDQFKTLLTQGIKPNGEHAGLMSVVAQNRFIKLTDQEITEIFDYLRSDEFATNIGTHSGKRSP